MSDSLLDVFVDVGARGIPQTEQDLQDFINRVGAAFGGLSQKAAGAFNAVGTATKAAASAAGTAAAAATSATTSAASTAAKAAAQKVVAGMQAEILKFEQQKFEFDFQIRLLGDADIRRQVSDIQSEVNAAKRAFALSGDDESRNAARDRVVAAQQELAAVEQIAAERLRQTGLSEPAFDADNASRAFGQVKNEAASLNLQLSEAAKLVGKASDAKLSRSFRDTAEAARKINLELNTAIQAKDFIRAETALEDLKKLRLEIRYARLEAEQAISFRIVGQEIEDEFDRVIRRAKIIQTETKIRLSVVSDEDSDRLFANLNRQLDILTIKYREAAESGDQGNRRIALREINDLLETEYTLLKQNVDRIAQDKGIRPFQMDLASDFRKETEAVEEFNLQLKQSSQIISQAKSPAITDDFRALQKEAQDLNLKLKQALDIGDLASYQQLSAQLQSLNSQLQTLVGSARSQIKINADSTAAQDAFDEVILKAKVAQNITKLAIDLTGDEDLRQQLTDTNRLLDIAKLKFEQANNANDTTARVAAQNEVNRLLSEYNTLEAQASRLAAQRGISGTQNTAQEFRTATQAVATFNLELRQAAQIISRAKTPKLSDDFLTLQQQADQLNLKLKQALETGDLKSYRMISSQLFALQSQIDRLRADADQQIQLKLQIPDLKKDFAATVRELDVQLTDLGAGKLGFLDADQKKGLLIAKKQLQALKDEFQAISSQAELTSADILRMSEIIQRLKAEAGEIGPVGQMKDIFGKVSDTNRSFNTLNNNAYQFGQLIEDAAIGYELNGISGALRGAGNNASFLLANMVSNANAAGSLSAKMGFLLTTLSGVGIAAAMIVLPRMIEWLQSLDDIEMKVKDIADTLKEEFENVMLRVNLELDQAAEVRALAEIQGVIDAIEAAIDRAEDSDALRLKITAILDNQSIQNVLRDATSNTAQIAQAAQSQIDDLIRSARAAAASVGADPNQDVIPLVATFGNLEALLNLENLRDTASQFAQLREQIFEDSKAGIVDPNTLQAAKDSLTTIIRELESLRDKVSEADAKKLEENIAAARDELGKLNEDAQKLQAILDADAAAMDALRESATKISDELQFMNEVNQGNFAAEETVLFDIEKQKQGFGEAAQELIDLKGATDDVINTLEDLAQKTQIEIVIKGETELRKLNDELVDLSVKIKDINEEIAQNNIEAAKKQQDAQVKAAEKIADLQARLQDIATKKAFENQRSAIQTQIDFLRSQLDEFQPDQFTLGDPGTQLMGIGANQIESQISALEFQLRNLDRARQQAEEAKQIADINKQIAETQNKLAEELKKIEEERIKAEEDLMIEMRGLGDIMIKLEEQESRLEEAIRNFDPTIQMPGGLPAGPAAAAEAAVMGSEWIQGVFEQLMQNTPRVPPGPWSAIDPNMGQQAGIGPQFRPEQPQFAPEDMPAIQDAAGMQRAQAQAMDAAFSSADFKSSSLEGLIDQSNRLLSTLGAAVDRLDVTARYA